MRILTFSSVLLCVVLAACGDEEKPRTETTTDTTKADVINTRYSDTSCYRSAIAGDTISMQVITLADSVVGFLAYNFKEKDDNIGSIRGRLRGDTLLAEYTFSSEGIRSVRQVAFIRKDSVYVEGFGESSMVNNKMIFKNPDSLKFPSSTKLSKVECE